MRGLDPARRAYRGRQKGVALILLAVLIVMGGSWLIVGALTATSNRTAEDRARNGVVLSEAKQALIAYVAQQAALSSENNPGRLPCPEAAGYFGDITQEGIAAGTCSLPKVGRLPWRTLGIEKLTDAGGEPLWYVVSPGWAYDGGTLQINSNTQGQLTVDGGANAAVALIIAPGVPLDVQASGACSARTQVRKTLDASNAVVPPDYRDYVECENATSPSDATFVTTGPSTSFNDQVLAVSVADLMPVVEGAVAARIKRDVVPQLQSVYASATWGASSTAPIFPFAAPFANPSGYDFKGVAGTTQGLLPLSASTCTSLTAGRCDSTFVQWVTASISASRAGGTATSSSVDCSASTASEVRCTYTYSRLCLLSVNSTCTLSGGTATVNTNANNVGMAMRTMTTSPIVGLTSPTLTAPIASTGAAAASVQGTLPTTTCKTTVPVGFGLFRCPVGLTVSNTAAVTVPIAVFPDHAFLNPAPGDAWYWFFANNWHHLTYYATAASHAPSGAAHNCSSAGDCISVDRGTPSSAIRATLALAGRSLSGAARPNAAFDDFLDSSENRNGDRAFEQNKISKSFNDRFVTLGNY